ncbi:MAG: type 1 glutamine amidotransferase family protein [Chitinophagales bacterium]
MIHTNQKKKVYVFLFDGYADWELGFVLPELQKSGRYEIKTFSLDQRPLLSMGGLLVKPSIGIDRISMEEAAILILPGGSAWEEKKLNGIVPTILSFRKKKIPIAAICAATTMVAEIGLLNEVEHCSNAKEYLKAIALEYRGEDLYRDAPAVRDKDIITASGTAPIEFAREIFAALGIHEEDRLNKWFMLFKHGIWDN